MADRNRRKSSILKLPKSNARAPLQDVNTLEVKSSLDDDLTSYTALARRRVSFAGKNFVKEFCSEADIVSVYHAPEYEELLASAESSGLVTSDSSNTHSSTTMSENNSTFGSRTQLSAFKSVSIQDEYDPCDEIMQQFKGKKAPQTQAQAHKPSGKTRLSFGDIRLPNFEAEDAPAVQTSTGNLENCTSHKIMDAHKSNLMTRTQNVNPVLGSTSVYQEQNVQLASQNINLLGQEHQIANHERDKADHQKVFANTEEERKSQVDRFLFEGILAQPDHQASPPSLVGALVPTPTMEDSVFESHVNVVYSSSEAPKTGVDVDCGLADTTQCMNESMDFTRGVPGVIHIGFLENPVADDNQIQLEHIRESLPHSKTQIMCTSMEFTQALPSNIQIDFQHGNTAFLGERENKICNSKKAKNTSMKPSSPLPSDIQVDFPIGRTTGVLQTEKEAANQTEAMDSSMEMTRPLPSNIQVGLASDDNAGIPHKESSMANCTMAMHTSMEMTRPLPSNIQVGLASDDIAGIPLKESSISNCTTAMETSMEMTRPLPSNILVGLASNDIGGIPHKESGMANCTMAMDMSMEMTRPLPSNIQVGLASNDIAGIPLKESSVSNCTTAMETSMEMTRPLPSNIQVGLASNDIAGNPHKESGVKNPSSSFKDGFDKGGNVESNIRQQSFTIRSSEVHELLTKDPPMEIEDSFVLAADPFKSKPRLHSSPPRQSGIEAVNVQSLSKKVADPFQVGTEHMQSGMSLSNMSDITRTMPNELHEKPLSKTYIGSDPDKPKVTSTLLHNVKATVEEEVRSLEVPPRTAGITETSPRTKPHFSGSKSPNSIALKAVIEGNVSQKASSKSEHPTLFLDVSNPFKSKSRLMISPIKHSNEFSVHVSPSNKEADGQNSEVKKDDCKQPITADLLCDVSKHHPMLFDEPHPFQDVPSFTMEISASINDSGANLLHTTIRNAEITLRQMHSPDLGEMQPISRNKEKSCLVKALEDMDCDPIPSQGTSLAQLPCNEANSQITSREDGGSIIKKSSSNDTDPIENIKTAKRLRDHSLDCERVDPDTSDESSSSKRLCKLRPVAVSKECQETLNDTFGSNLSGKMSEMHSSFGSNRNCSNASSSDSSNASSSDDLVRSLDDIVLNPKLWIAIKKGEDLWSFSFTHMCIELKVHLKMSSTAKGIVEGSHGHFISHVTDSTKPIMRWSMKILMDKLQTEEWDRLLHHSLNFLDTMRKLSDTVIEIKRFMAEAIAQEGLLNLKYTPSSFSTIIISFKLHLCFQVTVELDLLEKYTPDHITVVNIFGKVREQEVKNLVTGVKKDRFFVRNYIRDIKDYVVTLESFCK